MELSEEYIRWRDKVRKFAEDVILPTAAHYDDISVFPEENVKKMAKMGLLGLTIPKEYGGFYRDSLTYIIAVEEISRVCGGHGLFMAAHNSLANAHILQFGSEEQKKKYLPPLAKGEKISAWALTESNAGSDAGETKTTAVKKDGKYILNGTKIFITSGNVAETFVIMARSSKEKGTRGISAFIVERGFNGFSIGGLENKMGVRASLTAEIILEDCEIPEENLIGNEGDGFKQALANLDGGRVSIAAFSLGMAQGALDACLKVVKNSEISKKQSTQFMLADMATRIESARLLVYKSAVLKDKKSRITMESSMAKLYASEVAMEVSERCTRILGMEGVKRQCICQRLFRDAKLAEIGEGTSEIQKLVIARQLGLK